MPDAQYDEDIDSTKTFPVLEKTGSHGMEGKLGEEYVNGMMGDEKLSDRVNLLGEKKTLVGGEYVDLV